VVDAAANNPDAGHKELARIASDELEGDSVSRSYVPAILEQQGHIIRERREIADNRRFEGEERTEGDPFDGLEADDSPQHITERPHKDTGESPGVTVEFRQADVQQALTDPETPTWLKEAVTDALVKQAFA
jgi:DNA replication initiation complex subunit (GINS family)